MIGVSIDIFFSFLSVFICVIFLHFSFLSVLFVYRVYDFHNNNVGIRLSYVHNEDQSINQSINQSISRSID